MKMRFLSFIIGMTGALLAGAASAGESEITYSVPGVINTSSFGTLFFCANHGFGNATVTIEIFDGAGTSMFTYPAVIGVNGSVAISTQPIGTLPTNSLGLGIINTGAAKVTYGAKGPVCTAWVQAPGGGTAGYMNGLPFFRKGIQK